MTNNPNAVAYILQMRQEGLAQVEADIKVAAQAFQVFADKQTALFNSGGVSAADYGKALKAAKADLDSMTGALRTMENAGSLAGGGTGALNEKMTTLHEVLGSSRRETMFFEQSILSLTGVTGPAARGLEALATGMGAIGLVIVAVSFAAQAVKGALDELVPGIASVNKELDAVSKKSAAAEELAKFSGVSVSTATAALNFAKAHEEAAAALQKVLDESQAATPVLSGLGGAVHATAIMFAQLFILTDAGAHGTTTMTAAMLEGKTKAEAYALGIDALHTSLQGLTDAQREAIRVAVEALAMRDRSAAYFSQQLYEEEFAALTKERQAAKAAADALRDLNIARDAAGASGLVVNGVAQGNAVDYRAQFAANASTVANDLQKQLLAIEQQGAAAVEANDDAHNQRMDAIDAQGVTARESIARSLQRSLRNIAEQETAADIQAAQTRNDALLAADVANEKQREQNALAFADRNTAINQTAADRRLQTEQTYQDAIRSIQQTYALSYEQAAQSNDARGLVNAQLQRDSALTQAQNTRDQSNAATEAQRLRDLATEKANYAKQQAALAVNLADQKQQIELAYQNALRNAAEQAVKARAAAQQSASDQYADQARAQAAAAASEIASNTARLIQMKADLKLRENALVASLIAQKQISEDYAKAIVASLKSILSPEQITAILNDIKTALSANISITISPLIPTGGVGVGPRLASGGYTAGYSGPVWIDPHELVLPLGNPARTQQLLQKYMPAMRPYAYGAAGAAGPSRGQIAIHLDSPLLHATVTQIAGNLDIAIEEEFARG